MRAHKETYAIVLCLKCSFIIKNKNAHFVKELTPIPGLHAQVCNMRQCIYLLVQVWTKVPSQLRCINETLF